MCVKYGNKCRSGNYLKNKRVCELFKNRFGNKGVKKSTSKGDQYFKKLHKPDPVYTKSIKIKPRKTKKEVKIQPRKTKKEVEIKFRKP